jgi:hypothetical protein
MIPGGTTPTPERLAAYADGELHGPERAAVEAWLDLSPLARAELEALHRLANHCRATAAPEPSADAWDGVLTRLHAALPSGPRPLPSPRPVRWPVLPAMVGAAAAVLAAVVLGRAFWPVAPPPPPGVPVPTLTGPLDLADARDVDIICIDGDDTGNLLVGLPPVCNEFQLAGPGDITLVGIEPAGRSAPDLRRGDGGEPIIWPPAAGDAP